MNKLLFPLLLAGTITVGLHSSLKESSANDENLDFFNLSKAHHDNGKLVDNSKETQTEVFSSEIIPGSAFPELDNAVITSIESQKEVLRHRGKAVYRLGNLNISRTDLEQTIEILLHEKNPTKKLNAHKIKGADEKGNVLMTGYYTPIIQVSKTKTKTYKYPIYSYPKEWKGKLPSRKAIDGKKQVLQNKNLELAYAKNLMDIYNMQVQGSGFVEYRDGSQELFAFSGSNRRPYRSIGKYMKRKGYVDSSPSLKAIKKYLSKHPQQSHEILFANSSYVFFEPVKTKPIGAGDVELTAMRSIAVDPDYIPLGSILVATVPVINNKNQVIKHRVELLVAQDIGGAIKGTGHIDLYTGVGNKAASKARQLHHYGNLWMLLPKELTPSLIAKLN